MQAMTQSVSTFRQWMAKASGGESFTYARAQRCPRADITDEVRLLHDTGLLTLKQRKVGPGLYDYIAERRANPRPPATGFHDMERRGRDRGGLDGAVHRVATQIARAHGFGEPMPDRRSIALASREAPQAISRALKALAAAGQVRYLPPIRKTIKVKRRSRGVLREARA